MVPIKGLSLSMALTVMVPQSYANIIFEWVQPSCDPSAAWSRCLEGQTCTEDGSCVAEKVNILSKKQALSSDGQCGPQNGGSLCDPTSIVYSGSCCSQYGWCGNTEAHCGDGCQSGCDSNAAPPDSSVTVPPDVASTQSLQNGEPTIQPVAPKPSGIAATGPPTTDGYCGATHGNTICEGWYKGPCCSMFGFCGNTSAHCGHGCQSGPCTGAAVVPAPGPKPAPLSLNPGSFKIVGQSGVPVMHAVLVQNGHVIFLDKVENYTQLLLPDGQYAYSSGWDPVTFQPFPLSVATNPFCSGGAFLPDGRVVNVGGNGPLTFIDPTVGDGFMAIRYLLRSSTDPTYDGQSWMEPGNKLSSARWYASAQTMPDGTVFVVSGSLNGLDPAVNTNNNPTYEILDSEGISDGRSVLMEILEKNQPYYMYPFLHVLNDGTVFVFVSKSAEVFDVVSGTTIRTLPDLPGLYRTYPNTGGSVLLPLSSATDWAPDIIICGGGAYQDITSPTEPSCGRIKPLADDPSWEMDSMPEGRVMVEGTLLPDGSVIWLNGCNEGAQGFGLGRDPTYEALIYNPEAPLGQRFSVGDTSTIARLYHSVATLLLDGTLLVAGSNPVEQPILVPTPENPYVTEFRVEIYTPPYLSGEKANLRPTEIIISSLSLVADGSVFNVDFIAPPDVQNVTVTLYHGGFVTHSLHMGHRMAFLDNVGFVVGATSQSLTVNMPPNHNIAPPGPYILYVLCDGVPGVGQFVSVA